MIEENTRRELLKRLTTIAVVSGGVIVAANITIIKPAKAVHKCGHQGAPPCT